MTDMQGIEVWTTPEHMVFWHGENGISLLHRVNRSTKPDELAYIIDYLVKDLRGEAIPAR